MARINEEKEHHNRPLILDIAGLEKQLSGLCNQPDTDRITLLEKEQSRLRTRISHIEKLLEGVL